MGRDGIQSARRTGFGIRGEQVDLVRIFEIINRM